MAHNRFSESCPLFRGRGGNSIWSKHLNWMGVKSAPLTIKQDSVLKFGKEGTVNGVMTRCIIAKVTLHYPKKVQEVRFHDRTQAEVQPATQEEEEESVSLLALGESSNFFGGAKLVLCPN